MKVDLPALGNPSRPTSASRRSSSFSSRTSPGVPGVALRGARFTELLKWMLPSPPLPPCATSMRWPWAVRSPITSSVSTLVTMVPTGTRIVVSSPPLPYIWLPMPFSPRCALKLRWWRKSTSVFRPSSATSHTEPPKPPSPPSGPPNGMNFSRRKLMQPLPPSPAWTLMFASSTNFIGWSGNGERGTGKSAVTEYREACVPVSRSLFPASKTKAPPKRGLRYRVAEGLRLDDVDETAVLVAADGELDGAIDQREQRVVATQAHTRARVELGAALTHDDVAGFDGLAAVDLDAEVFRVRIATVAAGTYAFFMCHDSMLQLLRR